MIFGTSILSPSYVRKPHFKSDEPQAQSFEFSCVNCDQPVPVDYKLLIKEVYGYKESLGEDFAARAAEFYRIGVVGKSQDGGWPSMIKIECARCQTVYLIYAGIDEFYNSLYSVTIQGITELITN